jgi:RNA polymerase sigma-70 factor, ECF subfamily
VGRARALSPKQRQGSADLAAPSDEELLGSVVSGDRTALALLIRRYDQLLYRTARSILKDDAEAEDVVQEGFLLAYRAFASFRHDAKLSTWLVRIVANVAAGRLRKNSYRSSIVQLGDPARQKTQDLDRDSPERPDEALSRADMRRLIETKIDTLPDPYCVVFMLRAVQEFSVEETSEALNIPKATVRSRYSRARSLLRKALSKELDIALGDAFPFAGKRCERMVSSIIAAIEAGG